MLLLAGRNFVASLNQIKTENICLESKLIPVAAFLSNKVNSSSNLISIYSGSERFGYNAVDYKYFLEAFYGKKLLDWDPSDYKNSNEIFLISEAGEIDPLKLNIWELTIFEPKKVAEKWKIGDIHVYHLLK